MELQVFILPPVTFTISQTGVVFKSMNSVDNKGFIKMVEVMMLLFVVLLAFA